MFQRLQTHLILLKLYSLNNVSAQGRNSRHRTKSTMQGRILLSLVFVNNKVENTLFACFLFLCSKYDQGLYRTKYGYVPLFALSIPTLVPLNEEKENARKNRAFFRYSFVGISIAPSAASNSFIAWRIRNKISPLALLP